VAILQWALRSLNLRPVRLVSGLPILVFLASPMIVLPQDNGKTAAQTISASRDQTGQHPATAAVDGYTMVVCLTAKSDVPNPEPKPGCHIVVDVPPPNRIDTDLTAGLGGINFQRTGTMTLTCTGPGNLSCTAKVTHGEARGR
jgi:hypothetical protein